MPIYDFQCRDCGRRFETLVRGSDPASCPGCAGVNLERLLSVPAPPQGGKGPDWSRLGPPGGGCGSGSCGCH